MSRHDSLPGRLEQLSAPPQRPPVEQYTGRTDATERAKWQSQKAYELFATSMHWAELYRNAIITGYALGTGWLVGGVLLRNLQSMPLWQQLLIILLGYASTLICHLFEERRCREKVMYALMGLEAELAEPTQSTRFYYTHDAYFSPWALTKVEYFLFIGLLVWTSTFVWVALPHLYK